MYLSIFSILFFSIYTTCASPLPNASPIDNISVISKRADTAELDPETICDVWNLRTSARISGPQWPQVGHAYRSKYLGNTVLIKAYIRPSSSFYNIRPAQVEADVKVHTELGDIIGYGIDNSASRDHPSRMIIMRDNPDYISGDDATKKLGEAKVKEILTHAINDLSKMKNQPHKVFWSNFVFLHAPDGTWKAHYV